MNILIGGPLHGKMVQTVTDIKEIHAPIYPNSRMPREMRKLGLWWSAAYFRTNIIRDGNRVYRFRSGYYEPVENAKSV